MQEEEIFYERKTRVHLQAIWMKSNFRKSRGKIDILIIINMDANVYSNVGLSFIWFVPYAFFLISFHVFFP
jgi:hypothetical protein